METIKSNTNELFRDSAVVYWEDPDDMLAFFDEQAETDVWFEAKTGDMEVIPFDIPLLKPLFTEELRNKNKPLQGSEEAQDDTLCNEPGTGGSGLAVSIGNKTYLLRNTGLDTLIYRARMDCKGTRKVYEQSASKNNFCIAMNIFMRAVNSKTLCLYRNDKLTAANGIDSGRVYGILPTNELLRELFAVLDNSFAGAEFMGGTFTHEMTTARWQLPKQKDALLKNYIDELRNMRSALAYDDRMMPCICFRTSDVGASSATVDAVIRGTGFEIDIGNAISLEHRSGNTPAHFGENCGMLFAKFEEHVARLQNLLHVPIYHPVGCMMNVANRVDLPKRMTIEAINQFMSMRPDGMAATAHDCFWGLNEILVMMDANGQINSSSRSKIAEKICRTLALKWEDYDYELGN